ncbi:MAG: 4-hydroxybenzoate octaprenyltransferase [Alphaproteobacteria bacterium]|nr:4-hydroxybenzoate octaprenyltransferase [Alphaproteobacteria bacterium]
MPSSPHSDIRSGDWIDVRLPKGLRPYARLMRLDRPIGTWLLLWPCLWGLALSSDGIPDLWACFLFALGAVIMRGAGCVINDIYDRDLDGRVARTQTRPLVSGQVTLQRALLFTFLLFMLGFIILLQFNRFTFWLGVASLPLVALYPLAKRVTWWPQFVLGLAFNWGALMGWSAVSQSLAFPALFLYLGGVFWTLGYDTIYAHQDKEDDRIVGIKSLALHLGKHSRAGIAFFYTLFLVLIAVAASLVGVGFVFYLIFPAALVHMVWQLASWKMDDPANCLTRFRSNRDVGFIVFVALLCGRFFA